MTKRNEKNAVLRTVLRSFIADYPTLDEAKREAKKRGISANTSVWLSAYAEHLRATGRIK